MTGTAWSLVVAAYVASPVLAIVGLVQLRRSDELGRGAAVAALVLTALAVCVALFALLALLVLGLLVERSSTRAATAWRTSSSTGAAASAPCADDRHGGQRRARGGRARRAPGPARVDEMGRPGVGQSRREPDGDRDVVRGRERRRLPRDPAVRQVRGPRPPRRDARDDPRRRAPPGAPLAQEPVDRVRLGAAGHRDDGLGFALYERALAHGDPTSTCTSCITLAQPSGAARWSSGASCSRSSCSAPSPCC